MFFASGMDGLRSIAPLEEWTRVAQAGVIAPEHDSDEGGGAEGFHRPPPRRKAAQAYAAARRALPPEPILTADKAMQAPAHCVRAEVPLEEAEHLMRVKGVGHLPVLAKEGLLVGVLSDHDLLRLRVHPPQGLEWSEVLARPVGEFMASPAFAVGPEADIRYIAAMLLDKRVGCAPVINTAGEVLGIITRTDILQGFVKHPPLRLWA